MADNCAILEKNVTLFLNFITKNNALKTSLGAKINIFLRKNLLKLLNVIVGMHGRDVF